MAAPRISDLPSIVASTAGKLLSNPKTPAGVKKVAASALTQARNKKT
jgi:hypothetical protein